MCNGGKLEEYEGSNCRFIVYEIDQLYCVNCWIINLGLSVSCKYIYIYMYHSRFVLVIYTTLQLTSKS